MTGSQLSRWAGERPCWRTGALVFSDTVGVPTDTCPGETDRGPACQPSHGSSGGPWGPDIRTPAWACPPESAEGRGWRQARGGVLVSANRPGFASPRAYPRILQGENVGPDWTGGRRKGGETGPTVQKREIHLLLWQWISGQVQK